MNKQLYLKQELRRLRHFQPVVYGLITMLVVFVISALVWIGLVLWLVIKVK